MSELEECPRCGGYSLERLQTHSHCLECNYSPDLDYRSDSPAVPKWALDAVKEMKSTIPQETEEEDESTDVGGSAA